VHGVAGDLRASLHKPRKERRGGKEASRGWKGMRPKGGGQAGVRVWGLTLPRKTPYGRL
jgi:hypothetical protein